MVTVWSGSVWRLLFKNGGRESLRKFRRLFRVFLKTKKDRDLISYIYIVPIDIYLAQKENLKNNN